MRNRSSTLPRTARFCVVHPGRPVKARGLCGSCYDRSWRAGVLSPLSSSAVLSVLDAEGCWLASAEISARLGASDATVRRSLYRLRDRGLVESRRREKYTEWRINENPPTGETRG